MKYIIIVLLGLTVYFGLSNIVSKVMLTVNEASYIISNQ